MRAADRHQVAMDPHHPSADPHHLVADPHQVSADLHQVDRDLHQLDTDLHQRPEALRARLTACGPRPRQGLLRALIREACAVTPLSARTLAGLLGGRDQKNLVRLHLQPMLNAGELLYTIPQMPNHPDQKYTLPQAEEP